MLSITDKQADRLRSLYNEHVKPTGRGALAGHWKGPCRAVVPAELADEVAVAMNFMGSLVDSTRVLRSGRVELRSRGYWAHGF